jgi:hypothetical protein
MNAIHRWWDGLPGERYWLGITGTDGGREWLAAPCSATRANSLISHVQGGDAVFHFDPVQQAIVSCSIARGPLEKRRLVWPGPQPDGEHSAGAQHERTSWTIALEYCEPLECALTLDEIARAQWEFFPALRTLEDQMGDPLYYPFTIGSPSETRLLPGYVFKLPALFVSGFSSLAAAADQMRGSSVTSHLVLARQNNEPQTRHDPIFASRGAPVHSRRPS